MGKGDIKTRKGKITNHSFGKLRKHKAETEKKPEPTEDNSPKK
jgi:ribosomal small subunit protein bTHX